VVDALLTDLKFFFFWLADLKEFSTRPVPVQQALLGLLNLVANKPQVFLCSIVAGGSVKALLMLY
jgi:hypothetical protein